MSENVNSFNRSCSNLWGSNTLACEFGNPEIDPQFSEVIACENNEEVSFLPSAGNNADVSGFDSHLDFFSIVENIPSAEKKDSWVYQNFRQDNPNMTSPECKKVIDLVEKTQANIFQKKTAVELFPSDGMSKKFVITDNGFYVSDGQAGKGAQSDVEFTTRYATDETLSPLKKKVMKKGEALRNEELVAKQNFSPDRYNDRRLNLPKEVYELGNDQYIGIYEPCSGDLNSIKYAGLDLPATFIGKVLLDIGEGLQLIVEKAMVHCDIKGANLLYSKEGQGVVGDFGFLRKEAKENEYYAPLLTPLYAAPFIWKNIVEQKYYNDGRQTEASDVFSFGITIQLDILAPMLMQLGKYYQVNMEGFYAKTKYRIVKDFFRDSQLLQKEMEYKKKGQHLLYGFDEFLIFDRKNVLNETIKAVELLQGKLNEGELQKMKALALLAHDLQTTDPTELSFKRVVERLQEIVALKRVISSSELPLKKRKMNS